MEDNITHKLSPKPLIFALCTILCALVAFSIFWSGKAKQEIFEKKYTNFLHIFDLDTNHVPSINVWVQEEYFESDTKDISYILTKHCNDESVTLETRDVSCDAIFIAKSMLSYFTLNNLEGYFLRAKDDCLGYDDHACRAILYSMMIMEKNDLVKHSHIFQNNYIQSVSQVFANSNTAEDSKSLNIPPHYCYLELEYSLNLLGEEDAFKSFCNKPDHTINNENVRGYQMLINHLNMQ